MPVLWLSFIYTVAQSILSWYVLQALLWFAIIKCRCFSPTPSQLSEGMLVHVKWMCQLMLLLVLLPCPFTNNPVNSLGWHSMPPTTSTFLVIPGSPHPRHCTNTWVARCQSTISLTWKMGSGLCFPFLESPLGSSFPLEFYPFFNSSSRKFPHISSSSNIEYLWAIVS